LQQSGGLSCGPALGLFPFDEANHLRANNPTIPLDAAGSKEFYSSDLGDLLFHPEANHRISEFSLSTQAARGIVFKKVN